MLMPIHSNQFRRTTLITPVLGGRRSDQPRANKTPGIAIGIKISVHARFLSGMSVRSISHANRTAMAKVMNVPTAESKTVVPRAS